MKELKTHEQQYKISLSSKEKQKVKNEIVKLVKDDVQYFITDKEMTSPFNSLGLEGKTLYIASNNDFNTYYRYDGYVICSYYPDYGYYVIHFNGTVNGEPYYCSYEEVDAESSENYTVNANTTLDELLTILYESGKLKPIKNRFINALETKVVDISDKGTFYLDGFGDVYGYSGTVQAWVNNDKCDLYFDGLFDSDKYCGYASDIEISPDDTVDDVIYKGNRKGQIKPIYTKLVISQRELQVPFNILYLYGQTLLIAGNTDNCNYYYDGLINCEYVHYRNEHSYTITFNGTIDGHSYNFSNIKLSSTDYDNIDENTTLDTLLTILYENGLLKRFDNNSYSITDVYRTKVKDLKCDTNYYLVDNEGSPDYYSGTIYFIGYDDTYIKVMFNGTYKHKPCYAIFHTGDDAGTLTQESTIDEVMCYMQAEDKLIYLDTFITDAETTSVGDLKNGIAYYFSCLSAGHSYSGSITVITKIYHGVEQVNVKFNGTVDSEPCYCKSIRLDFPFGESIDSLMCTLYEYHYLIRTPDNSIFDDGVYHYTVGELQDGTYNIRSFYGGGEIDIENGMFKGTISKSTDYDYNVTLKVDGLFNGIEYHIPYRPVDTSKNIADTLHDIFAELENDPKRYDYRKKPNKNLFRIKRLNPDIGRSCFELNCYGVQELTAIPMIRESVKTKGHKIKTWGTKYGNPISNIKISSADENSRGYIPFTSFLKKIFNVNNYLDLSSIGKENTLGMHFINTDLFTANGVENDHNECFNWWFNYADSYGKQKEYALKHSKNKHACFEFDSDSSSQLFKNYDQYKNANGDVSASYMASLMSCLFHSNTPMRMKHDWNHTARCIKVIDNEGNDSVFRVIKRIGFKFVEDYKTYSIANNKVTIWSGNMADYWIEFEAVIVINVVNRRAFLIAELPTVKIFK